MQKENETIKAILLRMKIASLNEMQLKTLGVTREHNGVVLLSPTGTGKTLAYLLPLLLNLDSNSHKVQSLVIVPSRELALQIEQVVKQMGTLYKVNCCYGGHPMKTERQNLLHPPAILIGTPGRIADHLRRNTFDPAFIQTLILDEFDKSLEFGFKEEMSFIMGYLGSIKRRILTSATELKEIPSFTGLHAPEVINFLKDKVSTRLTVKALRAEGHDKLESLFRLVCSFGNQSSLIFCNHRDAVERISDLLHNRGIVHDIFHGGLEQDDREQALIKFRNGSHHLLITTDLASRGLDIPEVKFIVHYQLPAQEQVFIHRNGRTARVNESGVAYLVLGENEYLPPFIDQNLQIEYLKEEGIVPEAPLWSTIYIGAGKKDKINKTDIVGLFLQKGKLNNDELGLIDVLDYSAYAAVLASKAKKVVDLVKNETIKKKKVKIMIAR